VADYGLIQVSYVSQNDLKSRPIDSDGQKGTFIPVELASKPDQEHAEWRLMKRALLIDLKGAFEEAAVLLPMWTDAYELTATSSFNDALAHVTCQTFDLVIIEPPGGCPESLWQIVQRIRESALSDCPVMVHADNAGPDFYGRAAEFGAVVLATPAGYVAVPSAHDREEFIG
jgi:hypothetical protein